ncbi:hypothetical protein ABTK85_19440, partial [Acinetobacter baumannii]
MRRSKISTGAVIRGDAGTACDLTTTLVLRDKGISFLDSRRQFCSDQCERNPATSRERDAQ